jgi:hypothetical protein
MLASSVHLALFRHIKDVLGDIELGHILVKQAG